MSRDTNKMAVVRIKRSGVWDYFAVNVTDDSKVSCLLCPAIIPRGGKEAKGYSTSNMRRHLESKHGDEYATLVAKEKELTKEKDGNNKTSSAGSSSQPTIIDALMKSQPFSFDHPRAKEITKKVGEMIALDSEPFNVVNHTGFSRLLKVLEPRYQLPSDKYFAETLIPEMYCKVSLKLKDVLVSTSHISITTDVWSSVAQDSYISLTCHYVTEEFTQKQLCLHAAPFNDRHTGEHIGNMMNKCLEEWDVSGKVHVIVRDNGSNFVAGLRDAGLPSIPCLAHTLQLVVKDGCLAQPAVVELTAKARKLVGHYKHSNVALQSLLRMQEQLGLSPKRLIQDEATRWNTTFYMLERLIELKVAITATGVELEVPIELSSSHWALAEKTVKILQVYEEATREASGNYATAGVIIPVVNSIMRSLEVFDSDSGVMKMKREMLKSLKECYRHIESNEYYAIATLLDPRFKQKVFSSSTSAALAKQMLIAAHEALEGEEERIPKRPRLESDSSAINKKKSSLLWKFCDELTDENSETESSPESTQSVVDAYLKEATQPRKSDPLSYWKRNQENLPHLTNLAMRYLCAPPASVASERLFSTAGNICTELRNRLSPTKVEYLLFLNKNLPALDYDY